MARPQTRATAYKTTPEGSILYQRWWRMALEGRAPEWDAFCKFYEWAMCGGFEVGSSIVRKTQELPWGPDNCAVRMAQTPAWAGEFILRWNETVNRIRAAYGLPLF